MKKINFLVFFVLIIGLYAKANESITSNTTWYTNHHASGNVTIYNGATLTINPSVIVTMDPGSYIEVFAESSLVANNVVFTTSGPSPWLGMYMRGYGNEYDQIRFLNVNGEQQPKITLTDCTIENMMTGINNSSIIGNINEYTGGILRLKGCTFNDNQIGVRFHHYSHTRNNNLARDISSIYNCEFYDDNSMFSSSVGVYMNHVVGIRIYGCKFISTNSSMTGVKSVTASFRIDDYYANNPKHSLISESSFVGCYKGIDAITDGNLDFGNSVIKNSSFEDNGYAIDVTNTDNIQIYSNTIVINQDIANGKKSGIYVENCDKFLVVNNTVSAQHSNGGFPINTWGIVAHNCGELNNEIYDNNVNNCEFAAAGQEKNRGTGLETGLKFLCNTFTQSTSAVLGSDNSYYMSALTIDGSNNLNGVNRMQAGGGLLSNGIIYPSSSCFNSIESRPSLANTEFDFRNENSKAIDIIYMEPNSNSSFTTGNINHYSSNVLPLKATTIAASRCPSKTPSQWWNASIASFDDISYEMVSISGLIAVEEGDKNAYINNGDYDYMLSTVNSMDANNYIYVYYDLMSNHPSHDIIAIAVGNDVLPTYMVKDILMTNTYGIKSEAVRTALNLRQNQLSSNDMSDINTASETISQYETYMLNLSSYKTQLQTLKAERINFVYNQNLGAEEEEEQIIEIGFINELLLENNDFYSYVSLMMTSFDKQNIQEAHAMYEIAFSINDVSVEEKEDLQSLYGLLEFVLETYEGDFTKLGSREVEVLRSLALSNTKSSGISKSILQEYFNEDFEPILLRPTNNSLRIANSNVITNNINTMKIVPNPAVNYFGIIIDESFEYPLQLSVFDVSGRLILSKEVTNINTISTDNLNNGVYQVSIKDSQNKTFTQKLLISK